MIETVAQKTCKHFGECGGCSFQDSPYPEQLKNKEEKIRGLMSQYDIKAQLKPINFFPEWFYRNKMEYTFGEKEGIVCGLHNKNFKRQVLDLEECLIFSPDTGAILKAVRKFSKKHNYPVYNRSTHEGFLRNLIVRQTKFTNELMVAIITTSTSPLQKEDLVNALTSLNLNSSLKSIYWIINDALSDAVVFQKKELIYGEEFIKEKLDGLNFNIGIDTFFQVNPVGIERLYTKIRDYLKLDKKERVLDLYCGVGSIGIFLASCAKFIWGVDIGKEIIDAASQNAKNNNIENISFFAADTRRFLNTQGAFYKGIDVVVINPPRPGLSKKVLRGVLRLSPKRIVYSSCNPDSCLRDLKELKDSYEIRFIEPFDFFPHTRHVEILTLLERK
ncbi:MAG: 23S rRNA (uracil(1939)-C(5))-methyltransferase RlmD [Candidatus Omnitrophota bacterium]|nr:MAG: 23S rRNA (uracil(1939)-C(5))-methyltransferase RlmD [Candidatus Omnitrophota bacterium]